MASSRRFSCNSIPAVVAGKNYAAFSLHRKFRYRFVCGRAEHGAAAHVETGAMPRTLDFIAVQFSGGEIATVVRTHVLDGVEFAVDIEHGDRDIAVPGHAMFARQQFGPRADADPAALKGFSSSSKRRSSRFGIPNRASPYGNGLNTPVRW